MDLIKRREYLKLQAIEDLTNQVLKQHPMSIPLILYAIAALLAVGILLSYHLKISLEYLTTHEDLKKVYRGY
jgi:hypothetical protein